MPFDFNDIEAAGLEIVATARRVPRRWARRVVRHAQAVAPVLSGYLREHIVDTSEGDAEGEGSAESQADYSSAVNFGTIHMGPQPYFTNGIERANAEIGDIVDEEFSG